MNEINPPPPTQEPATEVQTVYISEDEAGSPHMGDRDFNPKLWTRI
jgi:hypothetical protein